MADGETRPDQCDHRRTATGDRDGRRVTYCLDCGEVLDNA